MAPLQLTEILGQKWLLLPVCLLHSSSVSDREHFTIVLEGEFHMLIRYGDCAEIISQEVLLV